MHLVENNWNNQITNWYLQILIYNIIFGNYITSKRVQEPFNWKINALVQFYYIQFLMFPQIQFLSLHTKMQDSCINYYCLAKFLSRLEVRFLTPFVFLSTSCVVVSCETLHVILQKWTCLARHSHCNSRNSCYNMYNL